MLPALVSVHQKFAQNNPLLRELKASVDYGQMMPNIPQMGRFFSSKLRQTPNAKR
jgi:maltose-binding protein MalE